MGTVDSTRIDCTHIYQNEVLPVPLVLSLSSCLAFPQPQEFTAAQLLVLRQHKAIAAANTPSPLWELPGWDEHQAQLNAVYALQGINPGEQAHEQAIARVLAQEAELAGLH